MMTKCAGKISPWNSGRCWE